MANDNAFNYVGHEVAWRHIPPFILLTEPDAYRVYNRLFDIRCRNTGDRASRLFAAVEAASSREGKAGVLMRRYLQAMLPRAFELSCKKTGQYSW